MQKEKRNIFLRYANDVVAKCAFGVTVNSFKDRNNDFYEMGSKFLSMNRTVGLKLFLYSSFPKLMAVRNIKKLIRIFTKFSIF